MDTIDVQYHLERMKDLKREAENSQRNKMVNAPDALSNAGKEPGLLARWRSRLTKRQTLTEYTERKQR